mmetsp:Transcript_9238/g.25876  ORF Transcript_9238/g.25876 Transcript_9238/m.25876 type:complete len:270 (-) Transcript_9238:116-925(-)
MGGEAARAVQHRRLRGGRDQHAAGPDGRCRRCRRRPCGEHAGRGPPRPRGGGYLAQEVRERAPLLVVGCADGFPARRPGRGEDGRRLRRHQPDQLPGPLPHGLAAPGGLRGLRAGGGAGGRPVGGDHARPPLLRGLLRPGPARTGAARGPRRAAARGEAAPARRGGPQELVPGLVLVLQGRGGPDRVGPAPAGGARHGPDPDALARRHGCGPEDRGLQVVLAGGRLHRPGLAGGEPVGGALVRRPFLPAAGCLVLRLRCEVVPFGAADG